MFTEPDTISMFCLLVYMYFLFILLPHFVLIMYCDGIASLGNMQISNSRLCESSKCLVYSAVNHPWWMSMLFHRRGGSAARYIWGQRWDDDNCQTGVALHM